MQRCVQVILLGCFVSASSAAPGWAQESVEPAEAEPEAAQGPDEEDGGEEDGGEEEKPRSGWAALPVATYAPETTLGLGGFGSHFFRIGDASAQTRPSSVSVVVLYTLRNQLITELIPELYWDNQRFHWWSRPDYRLYPNRLWERGPNAAESSEERYTENRVRLQTKFGRMVGHSMWLYAHLEALHMGLEDVEPDGLIDSGSVAGASGGRCIGIGWGAALDTRDHFLAPRSGAFHELVAMTYQKFIGSEYGYTGVTLNLRQYLPLFDSHTLAMQLYGEFQAGNVPFFQMAALGGDKQLRGYFEGRYRDKTLVMAQVEYRLPLFWRFGAAAFAGAGEVAPTPTSLSLSRPEWALGGGLRIMLNTDERLNLRTDVGFGDDTFGFYVGVAEAF